jgi:hypothetical protein
MAMTALRGFIDANATIVGIVIAVVAALAILHVARRARRGGAG